MLPSVQIFPRKPIVPPMSTRTFGHPEHRIVSAVGQFHFLTITQIMRFLGYSRGTKRTIEKRLSWLTANDYLIGKPGFSQGAGLPPTIYRLGTEGRTYLTGQLPLRRRFRPSDIWKREYLEHVLGLNDVLIAAERLAEESSQTIWLAEIQHDQLLQETPFTISRPDGRRASLVPDAWLDFRFPRVGKRPLQECYWLEYDRGTERQDAFREKIRRIIALSLAPDAYEERFGTNNLTVAIVTLPEHHPELRRDMLLAWIRDESRRVGGVREDLFFVTTLDASRLSPAEVFCAPVWITPFSGALLPLIELPVGGV